MEYFSHDYKARHDRKLVTLLMKKGVEGIGIFWCIIEMLYEEGGRINTNEYERITFELRTSYDVVKSVVEDFKLFKIVDEQFYSESVIDRLKQRSDKSAKARESISKRWKNSADTNVIRTYNDSNTIKESKEKERKEVKKRTRTVFEPPTIPELHSAFLGKGLTDKVALLESNKFWSHFDSNGWKVGGKTKMKSWQSAVSSWYHKMDDFKKQNNQSDQPVEVRDGN